MGACSFPSSEISFHSENLPQPNKQEESHLLSCPSASNYLVFSRALAVTIMKYAFAAALLATASAFNAPVAPSASTSMKMVDELELGVTEPLGVFDPLGWLDSEPESFERRRAVERKHGRICMIALVGQVVHAQGIVFDGYISKSSGLKFSDIDASCVGGKILGGLTAVSFYSLFMKEYIISLFPDSPD